MSEREDWFASIFRRPAVSGRCGMLSDEAIKAAYYDHSGSQDGGLFVEFVDDGAGLRVVYHDLGFLHDCWQVQRRTGAGAWLSFSTRYRTFWRAVARYKLEVMAAEPASGGPVGVRC